MYALCPLGIGHLPRKIPMTWVDFSNTSILGLKSGGGEGNLRVNIQELFQSGSGDVRG